MNRNQTIEENPSNQFPDSFGQSAQGFNNLASPFNLIP